MHRVNAVGAVARVLNPRPAILQRKQVLPVKLRDEPVTAFIALGSNLGDPRSEVLGAMDAIALFHGIQAISRSSLYASAPVDATGADYVNAVIAVRCHLDVMSLLDCLQSIEAQAGRTRSFRNAPRTLDLDILLYGEACVESALLTVPHPRMWQRAFVLHPLAEIAPSLVSSEQLQTVSDQKIARLATQ
jgi:2-amino-4-hydroxy-6-hydroxymethyldihydropteridine diphosphokinase